MAVTPPVHPPRAPSAHLRTTGRERATGAPVSVLYVAAARRDRAAVRDCLARSGASISLAADVPDALHMLGTRRFALVVVDLSSERVALATARLVRAQFPDVRVAGVTDPSQPLVASEAIDAGVTDLLAWPIEHREIAAVLAAVRDRAPVDPSPGQATVVDRLFEHAPAMRQVVEAMKAAASRTTAVLIVGERGSGRQLVARTLHERDHEYLNRPFVVVDCSDDGLQDLDRRLFGISDRQADGEKALPTERVTRGSAVLAAQGGSLFLTNVIDAPARVQARLARLLRDRDVFAVDLQETIPLDIRVLASAGPEVDAAVADGRLRGDLVDRLGQVRIDVPPLRRRREDVPLLAAHFLRVACEAEGTGPRRFSRAALTLLAALPWPGNAAELQNVVLASVRGTRETIVQLEDVLDHASFEQTAGAPTGTGLTLREARAQFERDYIGATLMQHQGRVGDAARTLGIQRTNLYRKVRQLHVPRSLLSARK